MILEEWWAVQDLNTVRKKDMDEVFPGESFNQNKQKETRKRIKNLVEANPNLSTMEYCARLEMTSASFYLHHRALYNYSPRSRSVVENLKSRIRELEKGEVL